MSRSFQGHSNYYLTISNGKDKANILVRNLQHDPSYKTSPHPVYKIDAFSSRASQNTKYPLLDFIVGYNMMDESFACLPIEQFKVKRSKTFIQKMAKTMNFIIHGKN
ncbi:hypothetical protein [Bacillus coahuilensis]|uniref:hypothetical protein n=1 Tax=Bacillus coahuilensis TaxID=408580 RepID=UPI000B2DF00C|nr:hypothetical protein [Bacillus coahuilensis]